MEETVNRTDVAKIMITFYNKKAGSSISSAKASQDIVLDAFARANNDFNAVKEHIKTWLANNPVDDYDGDVSRFRACFAEFTLPKPVEKEPTISESLNLISRVVAEQVIAVSKEKIESSVVDSAKDYLVQFIKDEYGKIEKKVDIIVNGEKREVRGILHPEFDTILQFIGKDEAIYLAGPTGSGKNVIAKQVADALGLDFYFTNAVTQEYKITGYGDAMGVFHSEPFYEAFTKGGLFFLDEMDASIPEVLIIMNAALANGYFVFPAPIGYKEAHPNFRVIAAGNTSGRGANFEYTGRNQLDLASLDRFGYDYIDYYEEIEVECAGGDKELATFCRQFRDASKKVGVSIPVSYRGIKRLAKMLPALTIEKALKTCLLKDLEKDDINMIARELPVSKYRTALYEIYENM